MNEAPVSVSLDEPEPLYRLPNVREVPEHMLPRVIAKIEAVNKKAAKLGVELFSYSVRHFMKPAEKREERLRGVEYPFVEISIEGPKVEVPGGWKLAGRVDFEEGLILVNSRPGAELPARYRNASPMCEHCNSDRRRNAVYVFELDGAYKQVGRSCLRDYLGHDPARVLWAASSYSKIFDEIDEENRGGSWGEPMIGVLELLEAASFVIGKHGFVSRKMMNENPERWGSSSASLVLDYLFPQPRSELVYEPEPADKVKAEAVLEMVKGWEGKADPSDYEYNCVELCSSGSVRLKRAGLLVSLIAVWNRANEARVDREKLVNAHVGAVGERRGFKAKFLGVASFPSDFGVFYVARFASDEGMLVYKGGSPFWADEIKAGDEIEFVGSIKEHGEYKEMKQSIVARCKLGPMPVKVSKRKAKAAEVAA